MFFYQIVTWSFTNKSITYFCLYVFYVINNKINNLVIGKILLWLGFISYLQSTLDDNYEAKRIYSIFLFFCKFASQPILWSQRIFYFPVNGNQKTRWILLCISTLFSIISITRLETMGLMAMISFSNCFINQIE